MVGLASSCHGRRLLWLVMVWGLVLLFLDSMPCGLGCGWVEHNDRFMVFRGSLGSWGFGTLLGPEETPLVFFLAAPGLDRLTPCCCGGVVVVVSGWGVVVC